MISINQIVHQKLDFCTRKMAVTFTEHLISEAVTPNLEQSKTHNTQFTNPASLFMPRHMHTQTEHLLGMVRAELSWRRTPAHTSPAGLLRLITGDY